MTYKRLNIPKWPPKPQKTGEKKAPKIPYSKFHIIMIMINRVID